MPAVVQSMDIERLLRVLLEQEGYQLTDFRTNGETGVDILALKEAEVPLHIEVIGYKKSGSARAKDFYEAFFRAISRLEKEPVRIIIAVASLAKRGLPMRAKQHKVGWQRIGKSFPELELWLVDTENCTYEQTKWNDWLVTEQSR